MGPSRGPVCNLGVEPLGTGPMASFTHRRLPGRHSLLIEDKQLFQVVGGTHFLQLILDIPDQVVLGLNIRDTSFLQKSPPREHHTLQTSSFASELSCHSKAHLTPVGLQGTQGGQVADQALSSLKLIPWNQL